MQRRTKIIGAVLIVITGVAAAVRAANGDGSEEEVATVEVTRGDLVDKALAVGTIEPDVAVEVKSKVSGVVRRRFADEGEFVRAREPLLDIRPDPTPLELVEARRQIELREIELAQRSAELTRQQALRAQGLVSEQEFESIQRQHAEAELQTQMATERLALLEEGRVTIEEHDIESVVTSPIDGYILERMVEVGDPVVPLSTYQEGTVLMTMANMTKLVFRGTVDEIDVGRLREGMDVELRIGALPNAEVRGVLTQISLQGKTEDNATTFPVEITLDAGAEDSAVGSDIEGPSAGSVMLRAGYSANADIVIARRDSVLMLPERVVHFEGDSTWVEVDLGNGLSEQRTIRTGLSDAINIEILSGLAEGDRVREKPAREIE